MGRLAFAAALLALAVGCTTITEELPVAPATPVPVSFPTPLPGPTPTAQPNPKPTSKPNPNPNPNPNPGGGNPVAFVTAGVHSYLRNGKLVRTGASFYLPGDAIYLNCTPRDANGQPTHNHGPIQNWKIYSTNLQQGAHFHYTDTNSFNPDLHIHLGCPTGEVRARCTVDGFTSKGHAMPVRP
jgi:hypothetical protein